MTDGVMTNPVIDVLTKESFSDLAAALESRAHLVVPTWEAMVRELLPAADALTLSQLRDHIPDIVDELCKALLSTDPMALTQLAKQTAQHSQLRFQQGFQIEELLIEYRLLRRVLIEQAELGMERRTTQKEDVALNMGIDIILHHGIVAFWNQQLGQPPRDRVADVKAISTLSHDLRNNVSSAMLLLELLRRRMAKHPEMQKDLGDIDSARSSLSSTIPGIEQLAKSAQGR